MKIDFHCHTKAVKSGESEKRNIDAAGFKEAVANAGVKMVAITNHNSFDRSQYDEFCEEVKNEFIILPGVELDTIGIDDEKGHVVIVYDDQDIDNFDKKISEIIDGASPDEFTINIDKLIDFTNSISCVVLAHFYKPDALSKESINYIREKMNDNYRLFYEPSSYRTLGIMINHNLRALKGTDIIDWNDYSNQEFANIKLDIDSYKQLMKFLKKDETVIESLINKQQKYCVNIGGKGNAQENIELYDDINVFFGTKGTGKSHSLEIINRYFENNGRKVSYYSPNDNEDKLDKKLKVSDEEKKLSSYGKNNYEEEFKLINNLVKSDVTPFVDYVNYVKYRKQNANKQKMRIVDVRSVLQYNDGNLQKSKRDYKNINDIQQLLDKINLDRYMNQERQELLKGIVDELMLNIEITYADDFDEKVATNITNSTVRTIKSIVEKKTETKTIPDQTGFIAFAKKRFILEQSINNILNAFDFKYESNLEYVGKLDENKLLYKKTKVTMLNNSSKAEDGFKNITKLKEISKILKGIKEHIYSNEIGKDIEEYKEVYENSLSLDDFMGVTKKFMVGGKEYKPSNGEATMIILSEALNENNDVFILDEPEKSLGNNYVSDVLVSRLNNLAKMKKVVIVATHNANVAVRTMPYKSILKVYDNGVYKTYVGNPYTNKLVNTRDKNDYKDWKEESIKILEGGKEAFEERGDIYA